MKQYDSLFGKQATDAVSQHGPSLAKYPAAIVSQISAAAHSATNSCRTLWEPRHVADVALSARVSRLPINVHYVRTT